MHTTNWPKSRRVKGASALLLFTPYGEDSSIVKKILAGVDIDVICCPDTGALELHLNDEIGGLLISQEGLTKRSLKTIERYLAAQASWSELPIVLFVDRKFQSGGALKSLYEILPRSRLLILERPLRTIEFLSITRAVISARQNQLALRDHMEYQQELRRELNHRIKNIMATAQALFEVSASTAGSVEALRHDYEGRLRALSCVHAALFEKQSGAIAIDALISALTSPLASAKRFKLRGKQVDVSGDVAEMLALAMHELITNSLKYGALTAATGRIDISWHVTKGRELEINWVERNGPPVKPPKRRGYGTRFLEGALRIKGGKSALHFYPGGLRAVITLPSSEIDSFAEGTSSSYPP